MLMPSISYTSVMDFTFAELKAWHTIAIDTYKTMRGIS